ncbi:PRONE domain, partial [Dillenia turbinata]
ILVNDAGIMTYNGLENCILNSQSYDIESCRSRGDECVTDSFDGDCSSCSSSKDAFGSFSSQWISLKRDGQKSDEWEISESPQHFHVRQKPAYVIQVADVETMKEKFAKLLLGDDITGGGKGLTSALALSNAITGLAASVFGELWKLEPLPEERKRKWWREMEWFLSPTNFMVELVPSKQNGTNGLMLEIMTPKARADIHMNLPALQKLDSMLIETMDSMVNTEFWYEEGGTQSEGRNGSAKQSQRWWLPSPRVPPAGLSDTGRKKLINKGKVVNQVFKAAKSIHENILLEMPVPTGIREVLPKASTLFFFHSSGKASLGEELYRALTAEANSIEDLLNLLELKTEHRALDAINKLEAAIVAWKERMTEQVSSKSPVRMSWSFMKDPTMSEHDKMDLFLARAEALKQLLQIRFPNLPLSFLDVTKIQYGKDVGHSILEAYSRVLKNLAFSVLSRMGDILQEDASSNPSTPMAMATKCFPGMNLAVASETQVAGLHLRRSLIDQINLVDGLSSDSSTSKNFDSDFSSSEAKTSNVTATPSRSLIRCIGKEVFSGVSTSSSP